MEIYEIRAREILNRKREYERKIALRRKRVLVNTSVISLCVMCLFAVVLGSLRWEGSVTAPGMLMISSVTEHVKEPYYKSKPPEEREDRPVEPEAPSPPVSVLSMLFDYADEDALIKLASSESGLMTTVNDEESRHFDELIITPGETILLDMAHFIDSEKKSAPSTLTMMPKEIYIDVVILHDEYITGYAVIQMYRRCVTLSNGSYQEPFVPRILANVEFPKIGGEYQRITEEYVNEEINRVKRLKGA